MTRLATLSKAEQREFELPPKFSKNERILYFDVNSYTRKVISRMEANARVGFILQLGYFKANARFYPVSQFRKRDVQSDSTSFNNGEFNATEYDRSVSRHRVKILQLLNWSSSNKETTMMLSEFSDRQASNQLAPRNIFIGLIDQCWKHRIQIPSYRHRLKLLFFGATIVALLTEFIRSIRIIIERRKVFFRKPIDEKPSYCFSFF